MRPRHLIIAFSLSLLALVAALSFTSRRGGYVEFSPVEVVAPVQVASAPVVAPSAKPAEATSQSAPAVATAKGESISFGGVAGALLTGRDVSKTSAPSASAAETRSAASRSPVYRPAYKTSLAVRHESADLARVPRADFIQACDHDHDLHLAAGHAPAYFCYGLQEAPAGPDTTPITTTPSYPQSQTFLLHSRPTATRKIYLDFTGHTTTGTAWNGLWSRTSFTTPPYSIDADTATFNTAEHAAIQTVWRQMAEDFAQFDVDVTTEDPGEAGLLRTSGGDNAYGMRVIFGPDQNATGSGGVAYVGSFDNITAAGSPDTPCFVFAGVGAGAKFMTEAGSHEVGHTVGLYHDGTSALGYYPGHGSGATSWAPIMGVGYYKDIVQWSKGDYTDANNHQDDVAVIAAYLPALADDHGDTLVAATVVTGLSTQAGGVINNAADVDLFKVFAGTGNLVITPKVALASPDLRMQIKVLNAAGTTIATYDATGTAGNMAPGPITLPVTIGNYYIRVDGIGSGADATVGYDEYGSLGYYSFTASWADPIQPPVPAISVDRTAGPRPVTINFSGAGTTDPDNNITGYAWDFGDPLSGSNTATGVTAAHTYSGPPGIYTATLTVTDAQGNVRTATQPINVSGAPLAKSVSVGSIVGSWKRMTNVEVSATATIRVVNQYGQPLRAAAVYVTVSGSASGKAAAKSDANGYVTIQMPKQRMTNPSTYTFTVNSVVFPAYPYNAAGNTPSPAQVTISR
jgi:hypothetical protein